ncbi:MAG: hypothetical protein HZC14_03270 [Candidatus Niyogibacteria bacterium]|nr:hypothetical protein [Candidatus Niyogibacteria bacterium]
MDLFFKNLPRAVALLIVVVLSIHAWALSTAGYFLIWWLDIVLHFLGGLTVSLFFLWFFYESGYVAKPEWPWYVFLVMISGFALFVGVQWEFFEFLFDTFVAKRASMPLAQLGIKDTMSDLFMDWMGALAAGVLFLLNSSWNKDRSR